MTHEPARAMDALFDGDEVREVLREAFYTPAPAKKPLVKANGKQKAKQKPKPDHYEVICISMYRDDLDRLDEIVTKLKAAGHTKMSRSGLIRFALDHMDTSKLPKAY